MAGEPGEVRGPISDIVTAHDFLVRCLAEIPSVMTLARTTDPKRELTDEDCRQALSFDATGSEILAIKDAVSFLRTKASKEHEA